MNDTTAVQEPANPADKVEIWPIERLKPYERNSRKHPQKQIDALKESISRRGVTRAVLAAPDGTVIVGHGVRLALLELGKTHVPVTVADGWSEAEIKAYVIADNQLAQMSEWDTELLALEVADLKEMKYDLKLTGFEPADLRKALGGGKNRGGRTDPDSTPEPPPKPVTRAGDIWVCGDHRLICGDSTAPETIERVMQGRQADLVFTSPPYGVGLEYDDESAYRDTFENCCKLLHAIAPVLFDVLRPGGFCVTNFGDIVAGREINGTEMPSEYPMALQYWSAFTQLGRAEPVTPAPGFALHTRRVWAKPHARVAAPWCANSNRAACDWEHLWTWVKPGGKFLNERRDPSYLGVWDTSKFANVEIGKDTHPAAFPVRIAELVLEVYSDAGDVTFEPFCGTGTALVVAEITGRMCRAAELSPRYTDISVIRWQEFTGKAATLEADGRTFEEVRNSDERTQADGRSGSGRRPARARSAGVAK